MLRRYAPANRTQDVGAAAIDDARVPSVVSYGAGIAGSGIPLEMASFMLLDGDPNILRVFSIRIAVGKFGLTLAGQMFGASTGREGPTVQIASIILLYSLMLGDRFIPAVRALLDKKDTLGRSELRQLYKREAAIVGGAAGISGAFNTPLGGIIFAVEEFGGRFTKTLGAAMIVSVALAGAFSILINGAHHEFDGFPTACASLPATTYLWLVPLVSLVGGLLGGLWGQGLLLGVHMKKLMRGHVWAPYAVSFACGLGLCATGYWLDGSTYGSGFEYARVVLVPATMNEQCEVVPAVNCTPEEIKMNNSVPSYWFLLKGLATWLSYWSGM